MNFILFFCLPASSAWPLNTETLLIQVPQRSAVEFYGSHKRTKEKEEVVDNELLTTERINDVVLYLRAYMNNLCQI